MADQVTISTFLELRDNLSEGLRNVAAALEGSTSKVRRAQEDQTKAAERAAKAQERIAAKQAREQAKAVRAVSAMLREEERIKSRTNAAIVRSAEKRAREEAAAAKRAADASIREAKRAERERAKISGQGASQPSRDSSSAGGRGGGLFGKLLGANVGADLIVSGIKKTFSTAIDTVYGFVKKGTILNFEYEKSISAISSAMYTMDISPSMRVAEVYTEKVMDTLRELAAVLPGEAKEYVEVYQRTIPQALMSGMRDSQKYAEFVSKYTAVAIQRGVGAKVAATNLQIMLQGTARAGTKMAQVLSAYTGKTINEMNRMTRAMRFDLIQKAVDEASSGMAASATKADAIFGTLRSHLEEIYRLSTKPFFENAKGGAADLNKWLKENKRVIIELSQAVTEKLGFALRGAVEMAKDLFEQFAPDFVKAKPAADPYARLEELLDPANQMGALEIMASPALAFSKYLSKQGEIMMLKGQVKKREEDAERYLKLQETFAEREKHFNGMQIYPSSQLFGMVKDAEELIKQNFFNIPGRQMKDVFADYMEYKKIPELRTQSVWEELIRKGVIKPDVVEETPARTAPTTTPKTNFDFRHSRFDIKQEFAEGFDPDRIAVAFASDLGRLGDMKLQAAYGLAGGVR